MRWLVGWMLYRMGRMLSRPGDWLAQRGGNLALRGRATERDDTESTIDRAIAKQDRGRRLDETG